MENRYFIVISVISGLIITAMLAMGCGDDDNNGTTGNGLQGASFTVGSKHFTEQLILGHIAIHALESAGASVNDRTGITGTDNVRTALTSGQIDMYWEYTGTGWSVHLGRELDEAPDSPADVYKEVRDADRQQNRVVWMSMAPVNNTYALAILRSRSEQMNITTISEYAKLANTNPAQASLCGTREWLTRADGLPGLQEAYGFNLPSQHVAEVELAIIPSQVVSGSTCNFGEVFATDPIAANDLVVLKDDRNFFVPYNVALTVRQDVYARYSSALDDLFDPITAVLDDETMQELNARVDLRGEMPKDVAHDWLRQNNFID